MDGKKRTSECINDYEPHRHKRRDLVQDGKLKRPSPVVFYLAIRFGKYYFSSVIRLPAQAGNS